MKLFTYLSTALLVTGIVGCGGGGDTSVSSSQSDKAGANDGTTQVESDIKTDAYVSPLPDDAPTYKVVMTGIQPPFNFTDELDHLQGIDVDLARKIGENQGFKVEFYREPWTKVFSKVEAGKYDFAVSSIYFKPEREQLYTLSEPYAFSPAAIMYNDTNLTINGLSDLKGLNVGVPKKSTFLTQLDGVDGIAHLNKYDTTFQVYQSLMKKESDAIVIDQLLLQYIDAQYPEQSNQLVAYQSKDDPTAYKVIMMSKGNTELQKKLNTAIAELKSNGEIDKIKEKWLK